MISIEKGVLSAAKALHVIQLKEDISNKRKVLSLCESFLDLPVTDSNIKEFEDKFKLIGGHFQTKATAINWYLKENITVDSYKTFNLFFDQKNHLYDFNNTRIRKELKRLLIYFDENRIEGILKGLPKQLLEVEIKDFEDFCLLDTTSRAKKIRHKIIKYLFDYTSFSSVSKKYDAYQLTKNLDAESCLYCNRNYTLTVEHKTKIIRPELDHFLPKAIFPLLAVSFYNLVPSCHICNSNLKGSTLFNINDYFHPYLGSFDSYSVLFTYRPENAMAFFNGIDDGLQVKLDVRNLSSPSKERIVNNIKIFKLNEIYTFHEPLIKQLQELKRLSNSNYLNWIKDKVFIDGDNQPIFKDQKEIYEKVLLNFHDPKDYSKRPMAKFIKDIATELNLI